MNDATGPGAPSAESPRPLTRRELRQQREAARAEASGAHPDQPDVPPAPPVAAVPPAPPVAAVPERPLRRTISAARAAAAPDAPASATPAPDPAPSPPPGGVEFGSLAGMFATPGHAAWSTQPTVLTVCTGNICRSPLAEILLRTRLAALDLRVHSAGTHGVVGAPMTEPAQRIAAAHGVDQALIAAHRARLLTEPLLDDADLILTMTEEQREDAVRLLPRRLHRTFPAREFARLAQSLTDDRIRTIADAAGSAPRARLVAVTEAISAQRGAMPRHAGEDVIDPYRRPFAVYEESAAQLLPALDEVERVIRATLG